MTARLVPAVPLCLAFAEKHMTVTVARQQPSTTKAYILKRKPRKRRFRSEGRALNSPVCRHRFHWVSFHFSRWSALMSPPPLSCRRRVQKASSGRKMALGDVRLGRFRGIRRREKDCGQHQQWARDRASVACWVMRSVGLSRQAVRCDELLKLGQDRLNTNRKAPAGLYLAGWAGRPGIII